MTEIDFSRLKVALIDDEPFIRKLIIRILLDIGIKDIVEADDGEDGLKKVRQIRRGLSLIICDLEMPRMDGLAFLKALRSDTEVTNPIILRARVNACLEKKRFRDQERHYLDRVKSEKARGDQLLNVILPPAAAAELKASGAVQSRRFENVAILFVDIVGFTSFCESHDPHAVVDGLQALFCKFEELTNKHRMEKIKTIGDEYMCTAGLLETNMEPLISAVRCAIEMVEVTKTLENLNWKVRAGVHVGPVIGGIVGEQKYQFDVWGDTVNTAARMTSQASPDTVAMTYDTWIQVQDYCDGRSLGKMPIKGKGDIEVIECYGLR